jgi:hypothetical protein
VFVTGFGDRPLMTGVAGGVLGRHHTQIRHQSARMCEAGQIPELGDERDGGDEIKASQAHECLDERTHSPFGALFAQRLSQPFDTFVSIFNRLAIFIEGDLDRRKSRADGRGRPQRSTCGVRRPFPQRD